MFQNISHPRQSEQTNSVPQDSQPEVLIYSTRIDLQSNFDISTDTDYLEVDNLFCQ
jgi:hypothetical protein